MDDKLPLEGGKLTVEAGRPERMFALEEKLRSQGFSKVPTETQVLDTKQYTKREVTDGLLPGTTSIIVTWRG